jgi:hypothetical protein
MRWRSTSTRTGDRRQELDDLFRLKPTVPGGLVGVAGPHTNPGKREGRRNEIRNGYSTTGYHENQQDELHLDRLDPYILDLVDRMFFTVLILGPVLDHLVRAIEL